MQTNEYYQQPNYLSGQLILFFFFFSFICISDWLIDAGVLKSSTQRHIPNLRTNMGLWFIRL